VADPREQRRFRRLTVRIEVSYLALREGQVASAIATTLGAGGLYIRTDDPLPRGEALRVRFKLRGSGREHELAAQVVWANGEDAPVPPSGRGMGIAFRDAKAQQRLARDLASGDRDSEGR
jgi:uncharacterized protein (TIGR02266 family)